MDVAAHEVAQRLINHSMPRHGALAAESFGNDGELPVAAAARPGARVARMLLAFVAQIQRERVQRGEPLADGVLGGHHPSARGGSAVLAGSSCTYFASHSPCAITKAKMSPKPPKSLKLTHAEVEKLYATQRFSAPVKRKNTPHATQRRVQIGSGSASSWPISPLMTLVLQPSPPRKVAAASQ